MVQAYGKVNTSRYKARKIFTERFPTRKIPNEKTFQRVIERLRNHVHQAKS